MRHAKTKDMLTYWMSLLADRQRRNAPPLWPERSDVTPQDCPHLLADMFVLERETGRARYRLAGTHLCNLFGQELKGAEFSHLFDGTERRTVDNWVENTGFDPHLVLISQTGESGSGDRLALETLLLPLRLNGQSGRRILGITTASDHAHWIDHRPIARLSLNSVRMLQPWQSRTLDAPGLDDVPWDARDHSELLGPPPETLAFPTDRRHVGPPVMEAPSPVEGAQELQPIPYRRVGKLLVIEGGRSD